MFLSSTLIQLQPELNTLSLGGSRLLWNSKESQSCWRRSLSFFNSCEYVSVQLNRHSYFLVRFCSVVHCGIFLLSCICCGCGPGPRPQVTSCLCFSSSLPEALWPSVVTDLHGCQDARILLQTGLLPLLVPFAGSRRRCCCPSASEPGGGDRKSSGSAADI